MQIHGFQGMTLLDYPGHVACTAFLAGCDFRCPFCHNYALATGEAPPLMSEEDLLAFLNKRRGLLDGVAFTGGEPLIHRDLPELISRVKELGFSVKLDTNGFHPDRLKSLLDARLLDYVAMDVKAGPHNYAELCGMEELDITPILESIRLLKTGSIDYEFRTTAVDELHDENDFLEIGKMISGARRYYIQGFIDRDQVPFDGFHAPSEEKLLNYLEIVSQYVPSAELRGV